MAKIVILEPARDYDGQEQVVLAGEVWAALCAVGRQGGYAVSDETVIPGLDARLFGEALKRGVAAPKERVPAGRRGSAKWAGDDWASETLSQPQNKAKTWEVIALLERGNGVVITKREKT